MTNWPSEHHLGERGFTLLEVGIVLIIVAMLSGGLLLALSSQRKLAELRDTRQQLEAVRENILAFAVVHGRLPCPANPVLASRDERNGQEDCSLEHGVLPWASLALPETGPHGQRLSYFASRKFSTAPKPGMRAGFTLETGVVPDDDGLADVRNLAQNDSNRIAIDVAAVVIDHGQGAAGSHTPNGEKLPGAQGDEAENADGDLEFVADAATPTFDDQLTWISPNLLKARLIAAGKLP